MRSRQCNKLLFVFFVLGVFASGMLSGIYYESMSDNANVGVRVAETRNINSDGHDGGHWHGPSDHVESEPHKHDMTADKTLNMKNTNQHAKLKQPDTPRKSDVDNTDRARGLNQIDNVEEHHTYISRKEFGHPIHLESNAPLPVPANNKVQANVDFHQQQLQKHQKQQPQQQQQQKLQPQLLKQESNQQQQQAKQQPQQHQQQQQQIRGQMQQQPQLQQQQQQQENIQPPDWKPQRNIPPSNELHVAKPAPIPVASNPGIKPDQHVFAQDSSKNTQDKHVSEIIPKVEGKIMVSVVICGDRTDEALMMVKSAVILTPSPLHFHIFAEDELQNDIATKLKSWPYPYNTKLTFDIHKIAFPPNENAEEWKKMFKKCATQRLFLPDLLGDTDALLYVDTDILFIKPLEYIWSFFKKFNSTQLAALTPEHEVTNIGWYNRFARHPYYGPTGLNSGVMLMNLTRMRSFGWSAKILPIFREYKTKTTWGDQDLLNILFHFHPELVYVYQCEWNVRPDHCMYSLNCHRIEKEGIAIIHGNRGVYHNEKQLPFRVIYEAFRDYQFGTDLNSGLVQPLKQRFTQTDVANMYCTKGLQHPLIATLQKYCNHHTV